MSITLVTRVHRRSNLHYYRFNHSLDFNLKRKQFSISNESMNHPLINNDDTREFI